MIKADLYISLPESVKLNELVCIASECHGIKEFKVI